MGGNLFARFYNCSRLTFGAITDEAQLGIFDYIEAWYNNERPHSTINGLSPNEFEKINLDKFINNFTKNIRNENLMKKSFIGVSGC